jgi:hypothetical protein
MQVFFGANAVGTAQVWTNEANSHKSFVSVFPVVYNVPRGPVTIKLDRLNTQTNTDQNDFYRVTVVELPVVVGAKKPGAVGPHRTGSDAAPLGVRAPVLSLAGPSKGYRASPKRGGPGSLAASALLLALVREAREIGVLGSSPEERGVEGLVGDASEEPPPL